MPALKKECMDVIRVVRDEKKKLASLKAWTYKFADQYVEIDQEESLVMPKVILDEWEYQF